jgi:hypothetical protein
MKRKLKIGGILVIITLVLNIFMLPRSSVQAADNSFAYQSANGWWSTTGYDANKITDRVVSGDFNGDGKTDVAGFYDYGNSETRIHVWLAGSNTFNYQSGYGWWSATGYNAASITNVVAGDFDGNGKDDIAVVYNYGNSETRIHVFLSDGTKFVYKSEYGWWNATGYDANRIKDRVVSGDFNKDGNLDILAAGNLFNMEIVKPRNDGSIGVYMAGDGKGGFKIKPACETGFFAPNDVKSLALIKLKTGDKLVLVGNNNERLQIFQTK